MRTQQGTSLIEMLSALFITSFIGAIMCEMAVTQNIVALKTYNKIDTLVSARRFFPALEKEIHMARFITGSDQTLNLQIPTFDAAGFPLGTSIKDLWLLRTISYQVVADPDTSSARHGQFIMQRVDENGNVKTVTTGIVGPINPANPADPVAQTPLPSVFQFYSTSKSINGVVVTMEIAPNNMVRSDMSNKSLAFSSAFKTRSNLGSAPE